MGFGGFLAVAVAALAARVLAPRGIRVDHYDQLALLLLGKSGFWLVVRSRVVACLGATLEVVLALAYHVARGLGWNWGESLAPADDARFSGPYTSLLGG